jgi:hypothetical protein
MRPPIGAITSEEEAHGNEKQNDETSEEIEEARRNQAAQTQISSIILSPPAHQSENDTLIAAGDCPPRDFYSGSGQPVPCGYGRATQNHPLH